MGQKYRKYSKEFRESALRSLGAGGERGAVMPGTGHLAPACAPLARLGQRAEQKQSTGSEERLRQENAQLKKALAKRTLEVDFLKAACAKVEALRQANTGSGEMASGKQSGN